MALYPVECRSCEQQEDVWQEMSERQPGAPYPACSRCGEKTHRIFTSITVHGMDTARALGPEYSHALSEESDPVYVKDRGAQRRMLRDKGLKHLEDGESEAARRGHARAIAAHQKEAVSGAMDQALSVLGQGGQSGVKNELVRQKPPEVRPPWTESPSA